jgi:hypothetical protein
VSFGKLSLPLVKLAVEQLIDVSFAKRYGFDYST